MTLLTVLLLLLAIIVPRMTFALAAFMVTATGGYFEYQPLITIDTGAAEILFGSMVLFCMYVIFPRVLVVLFIYLFIQTIPIFVMGILVVVAAILDVFFAINGETQIN